MIAAVVRRPRLWGEAGRAALALAAPSWWKSPPFLPVPESGYMAWRTATAYGSADAPVRPQDVVAFLEWRKAFRKTVGAAHG